MLEQVVQVFGSLLILAAFIAAQRGAMTTASRVYLVLNLVGSAILAVLAAHGHQWGFLLLEAVWALVSARALAQRRPTTGAARRRGSGTVGRRQHQEAL
jgi:uncharacterized SAM-binding protein YcdF (DUF218 family)